MRRGSNRFHLALRVGELDDYHAKQPPAFILGSVGITRIAKAYLARYHLVGARLVPKHCVSGVAAIYEYRQHVVCVLVHRRGLVRRKLQHARGHAMVAQNLFSLRYFAVRDRRGLLRGARGA